MKGAGMLVKPQGDQSGRGLSFFFYPERDHSKTQTNKNYSDFSCATLNKTFTAKCERNIRNLHLRETTSMIPASFI